MSAKEKVERLRQSKKRWEESAVAGARKIRPEKKAKFTTISNVEVDRLYTSADIADLDYERDLGFPGEYPFTRGVYPTIYRSSTWTRRQVTGFGGGAEFNKRHKFLASQGQAGVSVVICPTTHAGLDSDDELCEGMMGREGTHIDSLNDMRDVFDGVDMERTSLTLSPVLPSFSLWWSPSPRRGASHPTSSTAPPKITSSTSAAGVAIPGGRERSVSTSRTKLCPIYVASLNLHRQWPLIPRASWR